MPNDFLTDAAFFREHYGIMLDGVTDYAPDDLAKDSILPQNGAVTDPNSGVPALFTTYTDPRVFKAAVVPPRAAQIYGESKTGDWVTETAQFNFVEYTGGVASYDDFSQDGATGANANWPQRQAYRYQTWTRYGELEVERMGAAKLGWVAQKNAASLSVLGKFQNITYLFGVGGLQNFGALNDPSLPAPIMPTPKYNGGSTILGTSWDFTTNPNEIINDHIKLFNQLNAQTKGLIKLDTPMKFVVPSEKQDVYTYTNQFGISIMKLLKERFPNTDIEFLPEAGTNFSGGLQKVSLMQLFVKNHDGNPVVTTSFNYKLRAHAVERYSSFFQQKKSQGTWGSIWFYPFMCAQMVDI